MYQALISINDLFQVNVLVYDVYKGVFCIIFFIHTNDFFQCYFGFDYQRCKDTTGEISTVWNEVDLRIETVLQLFQRLLDFRNMLVLECFVHTHIVVSPTEMTGSTRFHSGSRTSCNGIYHYIIRQHQILGKRKQTKLDAGCKTAGVGYVLRRTSGAAVQFRQTVDKVVVVTFDTVVHGEVDNLQVFRYIVTFHEFLCISVGGTEEKNVDFVQR